MNYIFDDIEKNIIEELKNSRPQRIWTEYIKVIFEFEDHFVELECVPEIADSQNQADEAMTVKIRKVNTIYEPYKNAHIICENENITEINVVRTFLYFTDSITEPKKVKKMDSIWNRIISKIAGIRKSKIENILEGTSRSYHRQIICNPNSEDAKKASPEFSNLINVGILVKTKEKYLPIFVQSNGYGFPHLETKPFISSNELAKIIGKYELS
ncbi:hypothetical protein F6U93_14435 [Tamlana haliotis]|uniref:Uncharacterized protein n=1 Tax=Pseudotamlana haliotis TaxID=2614804 RepID=A0A6N6M7H1_9FLAO|nr:hypothetical protein [Tamlana haliotis]KAB1064691.1 hypothetical protein F6U93_14435 [Tamlana haliotis]